MKVKINFDHLLQDLTQTKTFTLTIDDELNFDELSKLIANKYPSIRNLIDTVNYMSNGVIVEDKKNIVKDGDEITLFISVFGG